MGLRRRVLTESGRDWVEAMRVLIVGCGRIAGLPFEDGRLLAQSHASAIAAVDGAEIVACVDPDADKRARFQRRWDVPTGFPSLTEALQTLDGSIDLIALCTAPETRGELLTAALGSTAIGVFCEKPFVGRDVAEAAALIERFEAAGKGLWVNYPRLWEPLVEQAADEVQSGRCGALIGVVARYNKGLRNNGGHLVTTLEKVTGRAVSTLEIVAAVRTGRDRTDRDGNIDAILRGGAGELIHLVSGDAGAYHDFEFDFILTCGVLSLENAGYRLVFREAEDSMRHPGYRELGERVTLANGAGGGAAGAYREILAAFEAGRPSLVSARRALNAERVVSDIAIAATRSEGSL